MEATSTATTTENGTGLFRTVATELSALGRLVLSMPLRPWLARDGFDVRAPHPTPVILVHGLLGDPTNFLALRKALFDSGVRNVFSFSYWPRLDYQRLAVQLAGAIEELCEETGAPEVDVIGHSLGGLVARYLIEMGHGGRVRRLVTLGAPYFEPRTLPQELGIFAAQDVLIPAPHPTYGPRGRVVVIQHCGHWGLLYHPSVLGRVARFLRAPSRRVFLDAA